MRKYAYLLTVSLLFLLIIGFSGCRRANSTAEPDSPNTEAVPSKSKDTETSGGDPTRTATLELLPSEAPPTLLATSTVAAGPVAAAETQVGGYPGPGAATVTKAGAGAVYPAPSTPTPRGDTYPPPEGAYPAPGDAATPSRAYPAPGEGVNTPVPGNVSPTITPPGGTQTPTQSDSAATFTPTRTPTVTPTPTLVRTQLQATDPEEFRIVSGSPQLVMLFTNWAPESKSMAPVMFALEARYAGRINFIYLDLDDPRNGLFKVLLKDRLPPVMFLLNPNGEILDQWHGYVPIEELDEALWQLVS